MTNKTNILALVIAVIALSVSIAVVTALPDKMTVTVVTAPQFGVDGDSNFYTVDAENGYKVDGTEIFDSSRNLTANTVLTKELTTAIAQTGASSTVTLTVADSGTTYLLSATGTRVTLPAVTDGINFKFIINGAAANSNFIIDSAEGDNIEGTLIVAGAVVDCAAEDQINFVTDGENIGDYVELISDGSQWLIGDSGVLTSAKMTCTDP